MKLMLDNFENGLIERVEYGGKRFYTRNGEEPLPSVTTLLSDTPGKQAGLDRWRKNTPDWRWINMRALERGNAVHEAIEHWMLTEGEINIKQSYAKLLPPLINYVNNNIDEVYGIEVMMHDTAVGAAGTADLICKLKDGRTVIGDYKTSEKQKDAKYMRDYFVQTIAYAQMVENLTGRKIDGILIMNVYELPKPHCNAVKFTISSKNREKVLKFVNKTSTELQAALLT